SGRSDQYSLAVTYCQLRGGRLPFAGQTSVVMAGHLVGDPDLAMLPEPERAAVARALSKDPAERWPDCRAFVVELAAARRAATARVAALPSRRGARRPGAWSAAAAVAMAL